MTASSKTRILYVNHTGHVSGAERILLDTLRTLDRERYEPVVACPAQGSLAEHLSELSIEQVALPAVNARFTLRPDLLFRAMPAVAKSVLALRRQMRSIVPDLIHANSLRAGLVASLAAIGMRTPIIWHVHDTLKKHPVSTALRLIALMNRRVHVIAVSNAAARSCRGRLPLARKVTTIHNGIDLDRFSDSRPGKSKFKAALALSEDDFLICAVGQICARKGLLELIHALERIQHQAPNMHLAIVGRVVFPHEEEYLRRLHEAVKAARLGGRVHFTGEMRDVPSVLLGSDLMILNSKDEPFGLVIVEAMASGTPVLATRVGGIPEIIADSENGWLVESGNVDALAHKLMELAHNKPALRRVAAEALRTTCPKFSLHRYQNELTALYTKLVQYRGPAWRQQANPMLAKSANP